MTLVGEFDIKPVVLGRHEAEEAARIMGARLPELPSSAEGMLSMERVAREGQPRFHYLAWLEGEITAFVRVYRDPEPSKADTWFIDVFLDPSRFTRARYRELLEYGVAAVRREGGTIVFTDSFDRFEDECREIEALGYRVAQTQLWTQLDLMAVDSAVGAQAIARAAESGIRIARLADLDAEGYDWKRRFYDMNVEIMRDVPLPMEYVPDPFEQFLREIEDPVYFPRESQWVAIRDERFLGITMLFRRIANPLRAQTGLTGVVREARRTGLATALKATAMAWAREAGIRWITADNERANPMYQLNRQLGFEDLFTNLWYRLDLN